MPGPHQVENACTALAALHEVNQAGIAIPEESVRRGLANARWPGRFERHAFAGRDVVFDGAHTPAAAVALVETWRAEIGAHDATVILGMGADKEAGAFLAALRPIVGRLLVTHADSPRAADPETIQLAAWNAGIPAETFPSVATAIAAAMKDDRSPLLITGSLFVAGEGREALGLALPDREWQRLNASRNPRTDAPLALDDAPKQECRPSAIQ
jgi:dihydrofolate synthase/folylpolyglutamate synthase